MWIAKLPMTLHYPNKHSLIVSNEDFVNGTRFLIYEWTDSKYVNSNHLPIIYHNQNSSHLNHV